jgi:hypothetical protein
MIIGRYEIFDAGAFAAGLERAVRGVLRVVIGSGSGDGPQGIRSIASAWLITDTLAVICDYVLYSQISASQYKFFCYHSSAQDQPIEADPLHNPSADSDGSRPALLRLREALPDHALTLKAESLGEDELVLVLHYPGGRPRPQLSIGRLVGKEGPWLRYDASTQPGSGGGAVLSPNDWALAGMHVKTSRGEFNEGLSLAAILQGLRESEAWSEIARYHNLANVTAARRSLEERSESAPAPTDTTLVPAAVRWNFDPEAIPPDERDRLKSLVNDPSAERWTLRASERQRLLRSAGSLDELRKARGDEISDEPGQKVIDRILKGPPYPLEEIDETALPYWLQAVRWFADVAPSLPTPAEVSQTLERRRVRSRLHSMAGPDFRGRIDELAKLKAWYNDLDAGPMVITGIGGVGKSALVARFAAGLTDPLLLWLDFDRADLAPDDAVSVLNLLSEQLSVQLDEFSAPEITESSWENDAKKIGAALATTPPPLLVLDGFEVAQQVKQHHEIWQVLDLILAQAPNLRVIVSGRAPVRDLKLHGRTAEPLHLTGMAPADAKAWLRERGITDDEVLESVLEISNGVPLVLKLALRLVEEGGEIDKLPTELPKALVEGFLYQRILDRVIDPILKPVARDALVLRSLTEAMIPKVLGDTVPEGLDAPEVFSRLSLEMGLVGDETDPQALSVMLAGKTGVLRLRPEVRSATLKLLEMDNAARVREIDERAAAWYAEQDPNDVANAAELVYHRLRLGDMQGAEQAWQVGCAALLMYAEEDLPETADAERAWLRTHTSAATVPSANLEVWEKEAAERIRAAFGRVLLRVVPEILKERGERSATSPLALYDAWTRWQADDLAGARACLGAVGEIHGSIGRDRAILGALFATQAGDRPEADRLLAKLDDEKQWSDRPNGPLEALAVRAARVRLAVDLKTEVELSKVLGKEPDDSPLLTELKRFLTSADVVLPRLCQRLGSTWSFEDVSVAVPFSQLELENFRLRLEMERRRAMTGELFDLLDESTKSPDAWRANDVYIFRSRGNVRAPLN